MLSHHTTSAKLPKKAFALGNSHVVGLIGCGLLAGLFIGLTTRVGDWLIYLPPPPPEGGFKCGTDLDLPLEDCLTAGTLGGLIFGAALSVPFLIATAKLTGRGCTFAFALKYLLCVFSGAYLCWVLGGCTLASLRLLLADSPASDWSALTPRAVRATWCAFSAVGILVGTPIWMVGILAVLRSNWQRQMPSIAAHAASASGR